MDCLLNATFNDASIIYVTVHGCVGILKNWTYGRAPTPLFRTVASKHRHGGHPLNDYSEKLPHSNHPLRCVCGYEGTILILNAGSQQGVNLIM